MNNIDYKLIYKVGTWHTSIPELDINYWIKTAYKCKSLYPSNSRSNEGGYQSPNDLFKLPVFYPLIEILNKYHSKTTQSPINGISGLWVNISPFAAYNQLHSHSSHLIANGEEPLSGVLYLKTPLKCGAICFKTQFDNDYVVKYTPKERDLIFFPQSLPHSVEPNLSQEDRISIAFNYG